MSVISMLPRPDDTGNIYTVLLYRALETVGLRYVQIPFSVRRALRQAPLERFHYVHFHWPEIFFLLRPRAPLRLFGFKGYLRLHALWLALKLRGYRLVWTVHEVDVHDRPVWPWAHALSRLLLWKLADVVFTHSSEVRAEAERRWGRKRHVHVVPHGNYSHAYPDTVTRCQARERLGLPTHADVFLFLGNLRPYKGIEQLLRAFRCVQAEHPEVHLVVAGRPGSEDYGAAVRRASRDLPNLHLSLDYVPDDAMQFYLRAADWFVAPYDRLETSGVLYLALSFDLPVLITRQGNAADFESHDIGVFMRDADQTEAAMRHVLQLPPEARARLRDNARRAAQLHSWDTVKQRYKEAFDAYEAEVGDA